MNLRPLIIDATAKERIAEIVRYAKRNIFSLQDLKAIMDGKEKPAGDNPNSNCEINMGYRVAFTMEQHPGGLYKHISISVDEPGKLPSTQAAEMIIAEFGFITKLSKCATYTENVGNRAAVNILEKA